MKHSFGTKHGFGTKHSFVIEKIYEGESLSFFDRLVIAFHLLGCQKCARDLVRYENVCEIMHTDFFTDGGSAESGYESVADSVMALIGEEQDAAASGLLADLSPEILPIRDWIISGVIIIAALTTSFFGMDFGTLARDFGNGFTIPLAVTIGTVITAYIAVFIGNHLKELSKLFGLSANE
ncbi:MAG: hypothetical protein LBT00_13805 [Spirochaetaceae bacterium]|jgi:hypothetical protein|nr:hypothetical protein [Spirochaetaceae bacterium]